MKIHSINVKRIFEFKIFNIEIIIMVPISLNNKNIMWNIGEII